MITTDEETITDVTEEVAKECLCQANVIIAQQKGKNVLILSKIDAMKRFDGKTGVFKLEHRWLSNPDSVHCVQGNDFTYWTRKEGKDVQAALDEGKTLFDLFQLF